MNNNSNNSIIVSLHNTWSSFGLSSSSADKTVALHSEKCDLVHSSWRTLFANESCSRHTLWLTCRNYITMIFCKQFSSPWATDLLAFLKNLGSWLAQATVDERLTTYLFQRLSVAVQRGTSVSVLGTRSQPPCQDTFFPFGHILYYMVFIVTSYLTIFMTSLVVEGESKKG